MNFVVLITTLAVVVDGGGVRSTCPALCRCEGDGMLWSVDCVDAGLRSVPSNLSSFTSSLDLSVNQLSALPAHFLHDLRSLRELRLAGNSLSEIEKDAFTGLSGLRLLDLQNNHLKRVPSEALKNLRNLRSLHLDANFISRLPASSLRGLMSLHHLWLDDNVLTEVPVLALGSLTELQALTLALNTISFIPDRAFGTLSQLLVLHLHDNRIHSLGLRSFNGLSKLETLDLSFNRINCFPAAVRSLVSLRALNLQNNNILVVPADAFAGNPALQTLNIQNNPLHSAGHSSFQLQPELRTLSLRGSSIIESPDFTGTNKLETLVSVLQLDSWCGSFPHCRSTGSLQDSVDGGSTTGLSTCGLDSLHFIFGISIIFNRLVLLSILLLPSAPRPPSNLRLPSIIFWFRLLAGLSGSSIVSANWLRGSDPVSNPGSGVFLFSLSSQACVFIMMGAMLEGKSWKKSCFQISCVVCCSLTLTLPLVAVEEKSLCSLCKDSVWWTHSSALVLCNTFCFLFMILTHVTRHPHQERLSLSVMLTNTVLFSSASLLCLLSLFSPDVSTCAVLMIWSLPCCVDPLLYMILGPRIRRELHSLLRQLPRKLETEEKPGYILV